MELDANQYLIESRRTGKEIKHIYWLGESGDLKNILKGQKLDEAQYKKFKGTINGIIKITEEINDMTSDHEKRINNNPFINKLETKISLSSICLKEKKND